MARTMEQVAHKSEAEPRWRRWLRKIAVMFSCVYVAGCAIPLYFMQESMIFPAEMAPAPSNRVPFKFVEPVRVEVGLDKPVESWLVWPGEKVEGERRPLVVYFHGNGEIIDQQDEPVARYAELGWALLLVEFRGYGRSPGKPSQRAIREDTVRLLERVLARGDIDASRVVFHGRSLGGGVAADVASACKPRALILESTFRSVARRADGFFVPRVLVKHPFYTDQAAPQLGVPVLVAHGRHDEVIPFEEGRTLAGMIPGAEFLEMECGHNDRFSSGSCGEFWTRVGAFVRRVG